MAPEVGVSGSPGSDLRAKHESVSCSFQACIKCNNKKIIIITFFLFTPNVCMAACMNNSKNSYKNICLNVGIMLASLMYFHSNY